MSSRRGRHSPRISRTRPSRSGRRSEDVPERSRSARDADTAADDEEMGRRRTRSGGGGLTAEQAEHQLNRRQYLEELQLQLTNARAQEARKRKQTEMARMLQITTKFANLAQVTSAVIALPDEQFQELVGTVGGAERRRVQDLSSLSRRLQEAQARYPTLRDALRERLDQLEASQQVASQVSKVQQHADVRREYELLVSEQSELVHLYRLTELLIASTGYDWVRDRAWMQVVRPRFQKLRPPRQVFWGDTEDPKQPAPAADSELSTDRSAAD